MIRQLIKQLVTVGCGACSWIESDRDSSEDVGSVESAFDNASDGFRKAVRKG